jgi:hypothetical protein
VDPSALLAICAATIEGIAGWVLRKSHLRNDYRHHYVLIRSSLLSFFYIIYAILMVSSSSIK